LGSLDDTLTIAAYCVNSPSALGSDNGAACGGKIMKENAITYY